MDQPHTLEAFDFVIIENNIKLAAVSGFKLAQSPVERDTEYCVCCYVFTYL